MGPSGSGKSTLLNLLGLLDRPDRGTYRLDGADVTGLDDAETVPDRRRMTLADTFVLAWGSLAHQPRRTQLIALAMSIGVGSVVVLMALREGARRYVLEQFASLGEWVRIGDRCFRVVGVLAAQGQQMGFNTDETVAAAQQLFNTESLFRILVEARCREAAAAVKADVLALLKARHEGEADVTVITQDAVLATFGRILTALTLARR